MINQQPPQARWHAAGRQTISEVKMRWKPATLAVGAAMLFPFFGSHASALETFPYGGASLPCGSSGTMFTNLGTEPANFEMGADWDGFCALSLTWTDANGQAHAITLVNVTFPAMGSNPSGGASGSLGPGGVISWTTAPSAGNLGYLNLHLVRSPSDLEMDRENRTERRSQGTVGIVGGTVGELGVGFTEGRNVICGSSGTLYTNFNGGAVGFDLIVNNRQLSSETCNVTLSWTDRSGNTQTFTTTAGLSQGVLAATLPAGGAIAWASSSGDQSQVGFTWQLAPEISVPDRDPDR